MIKKFFDDGFDGGGFGGDPINPFEGAKAGDFGKVDIKQPENQETDEVVDTKPIEPEVKKPEEVEEKKPDDTITDKKPEDVKAEVKDDAAKVDAKPAEEVKAAEPPKFNLDEEIKKVDKWELMKKAGFDDFEIDLLKYRAETGDLTPYLEAKSVDYSKFTDEQMMKYQMRKENPDLKDSAFDLLYKEEVLDKYKLDAEIHGDAAAELGLYRLKKAADALRKQAIDSQAKFKAPEKPVDDSAQKKQQEYEAKIAEYKEYVNENADTKALLKDKKLVFGNGDAAFNYTVEAPQTLVDTAINPQSIFNDMVDAKGNLIPSKFYKLKAYAANMDKIDEMLINHGKTIGVKEYHEGLQNPSKSTAKAAINTEPELTPAQALARHGKMKQKDN